MTATATQPARPELTPVTCQPWCVVGDGHPHARFPEDQWCGTESFEVPLSSYPEIPRGGFDEHGRPCPVPEKLSVDGMCSPTEPLQIRLSHDSRPDDPDPAVPFFQVSLTRTEALDLAQALIGAYVATARTGSR